ncbi:hypothetical protein ONA91_17320 [Micromonospora sp. DR5-3]|nr:MULTISPECIES: hypothetical protein [unclassified Micromonospora]MCW3816206.1 hypothetical protein [Micromonospora sp. DR5-3]
MAAGVASLAVNRHIHQLHGRAVLVMVPRPPALSIGRVDAGSLVGKPEILLPIAGQRNADVRHSRVRPRREIRESLRGEWNPRHRVGTTSQVRIDRTDRRATGGTGTYGVMTSYRSSAVMDQHWFVAGYHILRVDVGTVTSRGLVIEEFLDLAHGH